MHVTSTLGAVCALVLALVSVAAAQVAQCYNPNGSEAPDSVPCGSGNNQVCCPLQWQCLDNGLCYNPAADIMGRYSCTDQNWDSCGNNFCTYDKSNIGNEAILACGGDSYCCNRDRQQGDCCETPSAFTQITLPSGRVTATVTATDRVAVATTGAGPSIPPSESANEPSASQTSRPQGTSTNPPDQTSVTEEAVTSEFTSVITTDGSTPITVVSTRIITPTAGLGGSNNNNNNNNNNTDDSSSSNIGLIVGCAVGIPVGLIALGLLAFFLWRRRRQAQRNAPDFDPDAGTKLGGAGGLGKSSYESGTVDAKYSPNPLPTGSQGNPVEADGTSQMSAAAAASTRPVSELADTSRVPQMAELEGSNAHLDPKAAEVPSAPVTPVVGSNNASDSPVSSTGSFEDLRTKGAHAAHFGAAPLPAVKEGEVLQSAGTDAEKQVESTPGGRSIPSKPTQ